MASLCTAAAPAQNVVSFPKGIGQQVSAQSQASPHNRPRKFAPNFCELSSKEFVGDVVALTHKPRCSARRKRSVIACVVTSSVVEQELERKPASGFSSIALESLEASSAPVSPVLSPASRPDSSLQPSPLSQVSPDIADSKRPVEDKGCPPRPNGAEPMLSESLYQQVFRQGDSPANQSVTFASTHSSLDSLGQILEKAEKLKEQKTASRKQKASTPQQDSSRFVRSTWRKGVGLETPPPIENMQVRYSGSMRQRGLGLDTPAPSELVQSPMSVGSSTSAPSQNQPERRRIELKGSPLKPASKAIPIRDQSSKKPILKDVGARDHDADPRRSRSADKVTPALKAPPIRDQSSKKPILKDFGARDHDADPGRSRSADKVISNAAKPAVSVVADRFLGPVKSGKAGATRGKDYKEDWRKKSTLSGDGLKRRVGVKESEPDDGADIDTPGASAITRRTGRKMSKATRRAAREQAARAAAPVKVETLKIGPQGMSVPDLAQKLAASDSQIIKTLFLKGIVTTVNQTLDEETVRLVCEEFDVKVMPEGSLKLEDMAQKMEFLDEDDIDSLEVRPPVVTIMGHVDHGKTSLLDFIRKSKVAASEAGGITQRIGAYRVPVTIDGQEQPCVFLDTPGHEAFTAMRARGAQVTDVAVIVVAADDGVRPQTEEAIAHARAAGVPIVVAINKIDKEGAEPARVMQEFSGMGIMPEDWGGSTPMVQVSALNGENVDSLLETIMLVAEFQELKANPNRNAKGTVIESRLDKTKGALATLLVQNGTLKKGDVIVCGDAYGKIRALLDESGGRVETAGPSTAVQVTGLSSVPVAGEEFEVLDALDAARERAKECAEAARLTRLAAQAAEGKVTLASLATVVAEGKEIAVERHQLNVILKVDVQGTLEAIREVFRTVPQDTVNLRMLLQAVGDVTISDVDLASASEGIIIGFNVSSPAAVQSYAENRGVEIRLYKVIYELVEDIRNAMEGLLDVVQEQVPIGTAEVRAIFNSGSGKVAGCMVTDGKVVKGCGCKVSRGGAVVHTGNLVSLRRVKELAKEVIAGLECGVAVENFNEWEQNDIIEAFKLVAKRRTLEEASVTTALSRAAVAASAASTTKISSPNAVSFRNSSAS